MRSYVILFEGASMFWIASIFLVFLVSIARADEDAVAKYRD